nr:hypothetical protein [Tanacetum cinerariifolium]
MNVAQPKRTSFYKPAHSYVKRPFQRTSVVRTQSRVPRVSTVNRKFPTVNRKFATGNSKVSTADLGNKGKVGNSQNVIDDKGYWDNGCSWHMTGNISYLSDYEPYDGGSPRQHNMYFIYLNNIVPHKDLTCLVAKASADESELWHRRLGYLNFKTMNMWVRHNLVKGLPSKCFDNDHTCFAYLKGKQHKASYKTKDETSGILRNFITEIENLKDLKVKIIRCDNGGELRNKEMNDLCSRKRIKREFSNARTPQQNRVAERRNRTLIEAVRTMLANAKLPVTFWAEVVKTACYVQNRVLAKGDEGYFIGYSMSSKAFRIFNKRTKIVEENLHVEFFKNKLIKKGAGPNWLFDIDTLTNSMNYVPVVYVGTTSTNFLGTKDAASQDVKKDVSSLRYIALLNWFHEAHLESSTSNAQDACKADAPKSSGNSNLTATSTNPPLLLQQIPQLINRRH